MSKKRMVAAALVSFLLVSCDDTKKTENAVTTHQENKSANADEIIQKL